MLYNFTWYAELHVVHSTKYTVHRTQCTIHLYVAWLYLTWSNKWHISHSAQYAEHNTHCTRTHTTQYAVHNTKYRVQSTEYQVQSAQCAVHGTLPDGYRMWHHAGARCNNGRHSRRGGDLPVTNGNTDVLSNANASSPYDSQIHFFNPGKWGFLIP